MYRCVNPGDHKLVHSVQNVTTTSAIRRVSIPAISVFRDN